MHFVHTVRIPYLRALTLLALLVGSALAIAALAQNLAPGLWIGTALCLLAAYFVGVGFLRRHHP